MQKRVGLKQIAEEIGVDISTVSRALRGDPRVTATTTRTVREAAERMGYRPNAAARALRGGTTGRVAVLLSPPQQRFANPIFLELMATLDRRLREGGRSLVVLSSQSHEEEPQILRAMVEDRLADAVVLGRTRQRDARVDYLLGIDFPFVTFGRTARPDDHPWVDIDYARAGVIAVRALAAGTPDRLSVLAAPAGLRFADNYVAGAVGEAGRLGLPAPDIRRIEMTEAAGEAAAAEILDKPGRPALACIQDMVAFGVYRAAAARGITLGRDAAVFGGQNFPGSEYVAPPLSTFATDDAEVAELLARLTIARLDRPAGSKASFTNHIVEPTALLRRSHFLEG